MAMKRSSGRARRNYAEVCAAFNLRRASRAVTSLYNARLRPSGILVTQFPILVTLDAAGSMPLTRLAKVLEMDRTTLTRNWAPLAREGLTMENPGEDRRNRVLSITEKGRRTLARALPLWEEAQEEFAGAMGTGNFEDLLSALEQVRKVAHQV